MSEDLKLARQWVAKAANDLLSADNNLRAKDVPFDVVCFHCQQAAEKLLKAFLVLGGHPAPRTHDLLLLLEDVLRVSPAADVLRDRLALLMPYAVEIRYPDEWFEPTVEDAREARHAAGAVTDWLQAVAPWCLIESGTPSKVTWLRTVPRLRPTGAGQWECRFGRLPPLTPSAARRPG